MTNIKKEIEEIRKAFYSISLVIRENSFPKCDLIKIKLDELIYWYDNLFIPENSDRCKATMDMFKEPIVDYSKDEAAEAIEETETSEVVDTADIIEETKTIEKKEYSKDEIRDLCIEFSNEHGRPAFMKILQKLGVANLSEVFAKGDETINELMNCLCKEK